MDAAPPPADAAGRPARQKVWDIPTRLTHWLMAGGVALSWWSAENGQMDLHYWSGLTLLGLLVFRIYWGFAGPETARFASFVRGPAAVARYVGRLFGQGYRASFGHNPLGALSVIALLLALAVQVGLGLFAGDTDGLFSGPLNRHIDYDATEQVTEFHENWFNVVLALAGLHIAAIAFYLAVKRINLVGPMLTGSRAGGDVEGPPAGIAPVAPWRLALGIAIAAGLVWLIAR